MPGFGEELLLLGSAVRSLCFFHRKYKLPHSAELREPDIAQEAARALAARFDLECLRVWNIADVDDAGVRRVVIDSMREYFARQQQLGVSTQRGLMSIQPWIGDSRLMGGRARESHAQEPTLESALLTRIDDALAAHFGASGRARRELSWLTAERLLKPRPTLYRENLQQWLYDRLGGQNSVDRPSSQTIADAVRECLSGGRRHWPLLAANLAVYAQVTWGHSSALLCRDAATSRWCLWAEGTRSRDQIRLFDRWIPAPALDGFREVSDDTRWAGSFPVREDRNGELDLRVPSAHFSLPPLAEWYTIMDPERVRPASQQRSPASIPA
jgi:hypothetical protein